MLKLFLNLYYFCVEWNYLLRNYFPHFCILNQCSTYHFYFAVYKKDYFPYSMFQHTRNYFSLTNCFCFGENKNFMCSSCAYLKLQLNNTVLKICISESDLEELYSELIPMKTYLFEKIKVSPFFTFDEENDRINVYIDNPFTVTFLMI